MADTGDKTSGLAMPTARACALRAEPQASQAEPLVAIADDDEYWDYDDSECWNCGGDGFVYGCSWDWQCDTWDGDSCLCSRPCDICHPAKPNPELASIMAQAFAQGMATRSDATGTGAAEGNSPTPNGGCAPTPAPKDNLP